MRRTLLIPAVSLTVCIFIFEYVGRPCSVAFSILAVAGALVCALPEGGRLYAGGRQEEEGAYWVLPVILCLCMILCQIQLYRIDTHPHEVAGFAGRSVEVVGRVCDLDRKGNGDELRYYIEIDVETADGSRISSDRLLVTFNDDASGLAISDIVRCRGKVSLPEPARNPNTFDYALYLKTKGIYSLMKADRVSLVSRPSRSFKGRLFRLKNSFIQDLGERTSEESADLMAAILFGDKGGLSQDTMDTFRKNGTAHILAVSGLHIGIIYAFLVRLWDLLSKAAPWMTGGRKGVRFFILTGLFMGMYVFLAGFSPSVIRAVLMILLHAFAGMTGRFYDLKCSALAVGVCSLLHNPMILFQSGFQLSFLAVFSLSLIIPYLRRFLSGALLAGASIQIGLLPYMMYQFNLLPWLSVLINLPVIFLAGLLVPGGVAAFMLFSLGEMTGLSLVLGPARIFIEKLTGLLCDFMVFLNDLCCIDGFSVVRVCSPPIWMICGFYLGLVAFASEDGRRRICKYGRKIILPQIVVVLMLSVAFGGLIDDGYRKMDVVFVDVGQGDCIHFRSCKGNFLIDGGGSDNYSVGVKTLKPYLLKNGVRTIDGAFVTHLHTDHYRGICELAREGMVERLFIYESNRLKLDEVMRDTGMKADRISFLTVGQSVSLSDDPDRDRIDILWPEKKTDEEYRQMIENEEDENASSLIMRVSINGVSMLATGDMGEEGEGRLIALKGPAVTSDILKVGHHGSKYSSCDGFLDEVSPKLAVIQVGKGNTYGHPTPEVLGRLAERHVPVLRNDLQGAIGLKLGSGKIAGLRWMIEAPAE